MGAYQLGDVVQRQSSVEDVFDEDHVAVGKGLVQIFGQTYFAERVPGGVPGRIFLGDGAVSVAGNSDEIERGVERDLAGEVAEENSRSFENADEDDRLAGEIASDLLSHLGDALGDGFAGEHYFKFGH